MKLSSEFSENKAEGQKKGKPGFPCHFLILFHGRKPERTEMYLYIHQHYFLVFLSLDRGTFKDQVESPQRCSFILPCALCPRYLGE